MREAKQDASLRSGRFGLIAIAHTVDGVDTIEFGIDALEFFANAFHVTIDRSLADVVVVRVTFARQCLSRLHMSWMAHQRLQHQKFGDGELDRVPFPADDESLRIELERADAHELLLFCRHCTPRGAAER